MIKSFSVRNFRSLRDVAVTFEPATVLIGRSGSGKTNLVQALRFVRDFVVTRTVDPHKIKGGWPAVVCATPRGNNVEFEVCFDVPGFAGQFTYTLALAIKSAKLSAEKLEVDDRVLFHQKHDGWVHKPSIVDPPPAGQSMLGILYGIPEVKLAHLALTRGIGCYEFPGDVLMQGAFNPAEGTGLQDSAENHLTSLDAIVNNLADLESVKQMLAALQRLNGSVTSAELAVDRSHILVSHHVDQGQILSFRLQQESEGFRRFLAHLIAIHQQPQKPVLVFEEPEKGIYPGALAVLVDYFQSTADQGRSQVILTTHSPELLKHFAPEQIRVVEMEGYETKIGPLAPEQRESLEERLMTADELLTVDEARTTTAAPAQPTA